MRWVNGAGLRLGDKAEMSVATETLPLIAIVGDDQAVLNSLEFSLEAQGYDVCAFEDAGDALASQRIAAADCLVIDYGLPDGDGVTLLQGLRQRGVDCPAIIIDGAMPPAIRRRLVEATRAEAQLLNMDGITPFAIEEGTIGVDARALGAASLPLFANFMADRDVLFKESA